MSDFIEYTTLESDRWDLISWRMYGTASEYHRIMDANPTVPLTPMLKAGLRLRVPVIIDPELASYEGLPPWKR